MSNAAIIAPTVPATRPARDPAHPHTHPAPDRADEQQASPTQAGQGARPPAPAGEETRTGGGGAPRSGPGGEAGSAAGGDTGAVAGGDARSASSADRPDVPRASSCTTAGCGTRRSIARRRPGRAAGQMGRPGGRRSDLAAGCGSCAAVGRWAGRTCRRRRTGAGPRTRSGHPRGGHRGAGPRCSPPTPTVPTTLPARTDVADGDRVRRQRQMRDPPGAAAQRHDARARGDDDARAGRAHGRAGRRGEIDPAVPARAERVRAVGERPRHRPRHRPTPNERRVGQPVVVGVDARTRLSGWRRSEGEHRENGGQDGHRRPTLNGEIPGWRDVAEPAHGRHSPVTVRECSGRKLPR